MEQKMREYPFFIGGELRTSATPQEVRFPYTGEPFALAHHAEKNDLRDAAATAEKAFETTRRLSSAGRSEIVAALADTVAKRQTEFAEILVLEGGKTQTFARLEVARACATLRIAAEEARRIGGELIPLDWTRDADGRFGITRRFPIGPVLGIIPFNYPLNLACHKIGPAIAAGNPIILKPASATPISALLLGECALEAGLPPEALSIVPCQGSSAEQLVRDPRIAMLSFTGSPAVGWHLREIAGKKRVALELGGNAAVIVHEDAPLPYAASRIVTGGFSNAGQVCIAVQRVFLNEAIYDRALALILERVAALRTGDPRLEDTDVGPMISREAAIRAELLVQEAVRKGATLHCGGERTESLVTPAVLTDTTPGMRVNCEEAFAPVITVSRYREFGDALALANESEFGMQLGIFTSHLPFILRAFGEAEVGGVIVNDIPTFRVDQMPYGGVKASGTGKEGPRYAIREMTEERLLVFNPRGDGR
jgi:acyl-CoA reductase-like NAD-dependent aldehyde dehydrogenase